MRLKIEPPEAKRENYSGCVQKHVPNSNAIVLDLIMQSQLLGQWCWAAIAVSLGRYYSNQNWRQHEIATGVLGFNCSRFQEESDIAAVCNQYAMLNEALQFVGCYSHWSPGHRSFERIQAEIDAGRPICLRLEWYSGGSHYLLVAGYYAATHEIYLEDPQHGPSVQKFALFPHTYRMSGGVWRGTFWTYPPKGGSDRTEQNEFIDQESE